MQIKFIWTLETQKNHGWVTRRLQSAFCGNGKEVWSVKEAPDISSAALPSLTRIPTR